MPRIARLIVKGEPAVYDVVSRGDWMGLCLVMWRKSTFYTIASRFYDEKQPKTIRGLDGIYSRKRVSENI